jgi:hypothetical protein
MVMGMLAVRNLFGENHDLWTIDPQDEYLEDFHHDSDALPADVRKLASTQPLFPISVSSQETYARRSFAR